MGQGCRSSPRDSAAKTGRPAPLAALKAQRRRDEQIALGLILHRWDNNAAAAAPTQHARAVRFGEDLALPEVTSLAKR